MAIIVSKNNRNAEKLDPENFSLESNIQEYILENPNVIPLYDIDEDTRLFVAAREFRTTSGPIDALGFDEAGNIYVIETKLYRNPDKRTVVAQALDYGASLWKNTIDADEFITVLNTHTQKAFGRDFATQYAEFFDLEDASSSIASIVKNLNSGNIKFVVMMDKLHDALKDLILYVNQNSRFDIYAVELEYYKHDEFEIMIPKLYGAEVKKAVHGVSGEDRRFDQTLIRDWIDQLNLTNLHIDLSHSSASYIRIQTDFMNEIVPGSDSADERVWQRSGYYYEITTPKNGSIRVGLVLHQDENTTQVQREGHDTVRNALNVQQKKADWTWWTIKSFGVDTKDGDEAVRNDIIRIFTKEIPELEARIMSHQG